MADCSEITFPRRHQRIALGGELNKMKTRSTIDRPLHDSGQYQELIPLGNYQLILM
jgi:hypothetical protein